MWNAIVAVVRLIATGVGIAHEPAYIAVRIHPASEDAPARGFGERAA